jgi:catechol 2,3-dioxygenase-like lactoylglutathione lyase family enzyme
MEAVNGASLPSDFRWAALVPELIVSDLHVSLDFWKGLIGFETAYERPDEGFVFLHLAEAQVMLAARRGMSRWLPSELARPFGRGLNLEVTVADLDAPLSRLRKRAWPLYFDVEEVWYRAGPLEIRVRQFAVADPDGYLVRLSRRLDQRPVSPAALQQ